MPIRRSRRHRSSAFPVEPLVHLWLMRLLVPLGAHKEFIHPHGFSDDSLAEMLGLQAWIDPVDFEFCAVSVRNELRKLHKTVETEFKAAKASDCLARNLSRLSALVGLTATDCRILEFAVLIHTERVLDDAADWLGNLSSVKMYGVLAVLLGLPEREIRTALSASGILARSGLVVIDRSGPDRLQSRLTLLSAKFADHIISSDSDPVDLLRDAVSLSSPPVLDMVDFEHLDSELGLLRPYLKKSLATGRRGVNIFMHGIPGTGKSQLAKALAKEMRCELFEVSSQDEEGDPISGGQRLNALRAAQSFLAQRKSILLFDEVEDVFDDGMGFIGKKSTAQTHKAWLNRMLEENQVPVLWLSNSAQGLDPAFIRRFDLVFELPVPPKKQRERIIRAHCGGLLSEPVIGRIAQVETLAPAVVTRAAAVVNSIKGELGKHGAEAAFELIVNNTLETQGHARIPVNDPDRLPSTYNPAYINADTDIESIATGLQGTRSGRLCLYGPPGTGKTAYGRWLAEQLEMPLLVKRGSDLMSMYVGGTEQNIAKAFSEAEREGALLLIDEVDSFLQDRRGAKNSWEVTGVNEMLTQMESFSGVFIASTNLIKGLDQASLRRFDLKLKFDFMQEKQAWLLFKSTCAVLKLRVPNRQLLPAMRRLGNITPGDFAAVVRRHRFKPVLSADELLMALADECRLKEGGGRAIGFL